MAILKSVIRQGKQTRSSLRKLRASGIIPQLYMVMVLKIHLLKLMVEFIKLSVKLDVTELLN